MANIYTGKVLASGWAATSSQPGYTPDNLASEALAKPWRSTDLSANTVTVTFPAPSSILALFLHDVNFAQATIEKSADGVAWSAVGVANTYRGRESRSRGLIFIADPAVKAWRFTPVGGVSTDGLTYWRAGASYHYSGGFTIPAPFQFGYEPVFTYPEVRTELPNGGLARASTGTPYHQISVPFRPRDDEDLEQMQRLARAGTVLLDLVMGNYPWQLWPVRLIDDKISERFAQPKYSDVVYTFREMVNA